MMTITAPRPRPYQHYQSTVKCCRCGKEIQKSHSWRKEVANGHYAYYCPTIACYEAGRRIWEKIGV